MAKKLLLTLAVAGGGAVYYDRNVEPIFPRKTSVSPQVRKEFSKLEDETKSFASQVKKTAKELKSELKEKTDLAVTTIKDSDMYNKWLEKLDNFQKDVRTEMEPINQKPLGNRWAAKYIRFINGVAQTDDERAAELASLTSLRQQELKGQTLSSWSGWWSGKKAEAKDAKGDLEHRARKEKNSWLSWGSAKADEAEAKKDLWFSWADLKSDEAKAKAKQVKSRAESEKSSWTLWGSSKADEAKAKAEAEKNSWSKWGSDKAEEVKQAAQGTQKDLESKLPLKDQLSEGYEAGKSRAIEEYNRAKLTLESLTKQAQNKAADAWDRADETHLKNAKNDLQRALGNLKEFGLELVDKK